MTRKRIKKARPDILPCPFCGKPGKLSLRGGGWTVNCPYDPIDALIGKGAVCYVSPCTDIQITPESAIMAWNTRADSQPQELEGEVKNG